MSDPRHLISQTKQDAPVIGSTGQEELLKRGLVRVSIAADGLSPLLDRRLKELRAALRSDAPDHLLEDLLPELERAVLAADTDRQDRLGQISQSLKALARQLQIHDRSGKTAAALRQLIKQIDEPLQHTGALPALLDELTIIQGIALDGSGGASSRRGLLSRLFRTGGEERPATMEAPAPADTDETAAGALIDHLAAAQLSQESIRLSDNLTEAEPQYCNVAAHIETILLGLLGELQVLDEQQQRCDRVREQVQQGLNWYDLAAVLEELSGLVLSSQRSRQADFELYLQQLDNRLAQFQGNLEEAQDVYAGSAEKGRSLEGVIRSQVEALHVDVRESFDLTLLKANVEAKLDALLSNVDQARQAQDQREEAVSAHLRTMVERIQVMEVEAQTFRRHLDEQTKRAMLDNLTGLPNRAGLQKRMEEEFERWQRYGGQLLMAVLDVDHFKAINDNFGHLAGDKVLRLIAQQLSRRLRKMDFIGRFGGEEFVVLMPGTSMDQGAVVLEQLRQGIQESPFHFKSQRVAVTISLGYTEFQAGDSLDQVFDRADQAMYRAKDQGRNRLSRA